MKRRVSKSLVALAFAAVLCLSTPAASAMSRNRGGDPDFGTQIVRFLKNFVHHFNPFTPQSDSDAVSPPKP